MINNMELLKEEILYALDNRMLNLIILPTEKCNFRCAYCYEDFSIGKMPLAVSDAIKKLIRNRFDDLQLLAISWFGGEPLLNRETIYDISDYILHNKPASLHYAANMTTNGYLLDPATLRRLIECHVNTFQITLDGDRDLHNQTRVLADGRPTFDRIWENILMMHHSDYEFELMLRIHFTADNYTKHTPLIERLNSELSGDERIKYLFKPVERLGGANDAAIEPFTADDERMSVKSCLDRQMLNPRQVVDRYDLDKPQMCYASKPNSLMIRANGKIGKCTVALDDGRNDIGYIHKNGKVFINDKLAFWIHGLESMDLKTLACPLSRINYQTAKH